MTLEEKVRYITSKHPDFAKRTIRDEDAHGNVFFDSGKYFSYAGNTYEEKLNNEARLLSEEAERTYTCPRGAQVEKGIFKSSFIASKNLSSKSLYAARIVPNIYLINGTLLSLPSCQLCCESFNEA